MILKSIDILLYINSSRNSTEALACRSFFFIFDVRNNLIKIFVHCTWSIFYFCAGIRALLSLYKRQINLKAISTSYRSTYFTSEHMREEMWAACNLVSHKTFLLYVQSPTLSNYANPNTILAE